MRTPTAVPLALAACLAAAPACFAARQIVLNDPRLPLWEMRPLDRHVYVLTLEGDWKSPPGRDAEYLRQHRVSRRGRWCSTRPTDDLLFRRGEVQALLIEYQ